MEERDLINLEYYRFIDLLSDFTPNQPTKNLIRSIKPSGNVEVVKREVGKTQEFINILKENGFFPISEFPDITQSLNLLSIQDSILFPKDIYEIGVVLKIVKEVKTFLQEKQLNFLKPILRELYPLREIEKLIFDSIDSSYTVKDSASFDLKKIRKSINQTEEKISSVLERMISSRDFEEILQDRFFTIKRDRFVIPVKYNFASRVKGIIQDKSSTGQTVFVEPIEVVNLNNQLLDLKLQESIEIRKILKFITDNLRSKVEFIKKSYNCLLELDLLYTKGKYAVKTNSTFPSISDKLHLKEAYHPIFKLKGKEFVPIDVNFSDKRGLIITGSNTGGKTVALKTVGLIALLNQSGIPVPVSEGSSLPVFDGVFIDIGDSQSIEESLSTFSAHIVNINRIVSSISEKSLVLFDELIPGTDPDFASSLGIAILNKIKKIGSYTIATTHLRKIKLYALKEEFFRLAAVGFDKESLSPTYEIIYDTLGESMALDIARRLSLDEDILQEAISLTDKELLSFEDTVNSLNNLIKEYSQKLKALQEKDRELQNQIQKYKELSERLEKDKKQRWKESLKEIDQFIESIRREGYRVLEEVREEKSGKALESFIKTKRYQLSKTYQEETVQGEFKEGDKVKVENKPQVGVILQIKDNKAKVDFGALKLWVGLNQLVRVEDQKEDKKVQLSVERPKVIPQINLIGKTREEAIRELQDYFDKVILTGLTTFKVIHGFGSGVLRKAVREFLDRQPVKVRYEDAPYHEGGLGVTIVYLE